MNFNITSKMDMTKKIVKITSNIILTMIVVTLLTSLWIFSLSRHLSVFQDRYYDIAIGISLIGSLIIIPLGLLTLRLKPPTLNQDKVERRDLVKAAIWLALGQIFFLFLTPNFHSGPNDARNTATQFQIAELTDALNKYNEERGSFPTNDEGLPLLTNLTISGESTYIEEVQFYDSWGEPFRLHTDKGEPKIISSGPDMIFNTEDDISN